MNVPADQIVSRSRAIRASGRRRLVAGITAVAAAGSVILGLVLSGVLGAGPGSGAGTTRPAAFTLTRNANGTDTLTLSNSQIADPTALQRGLAACLSGGFIACSGGSDGHRVRLPFGLS
jgi:hypothetical protein